MNTRITSVALLAGLAGGASAQTLYNSLDSGTDNIAFLGAVYMEAGRHADAERVYRADLDKWPSNGWSLYGLSRAFEAQGKTAEAAEALRLHEKAWAKADAPTTTSCKCIPAV